MHTELQCGYCAWPWEYDPVREQHKPTGLPWEEGNWVFCCLPDYRQKAYPLEGLVERELAVWR